MMLAQALYQSSEYLLAWVLLGVIAGLIITVIVFALLLFSGTLRIGSQVDSQLAGLRDVIAGQRDQIERLEKQSEGWRQVALHATGMVENGLARRQREAIVRETGRPIPEARRQLAEALLDAFPSRDELDQLFQFGLEAKLAEIAPEDGDLKVTVSRIVRWAEATGTWDDLVAAARRANPGNPRLREFATAA